jgi:hypothetical protein
MKIRAIKLNLIIFVGLLILSFALFAYAQNNATTDNNIFLDSDQDGLSNVEEKMYGTDPYNPDTDGDGYTDGAEVKSGYDPLKPAPGDKIVSSAAQPTQVAQPTQTTQNTSDNQASQSTPKTTTDTNTKTDATSTTKDATATTTDTNAGDKNLTQEFSAKVAALVSDSSKDQQAISLQDLDTMIQDVTSSSLTFDDLPKIDDKEIKIKKQNYKSLSDADRLAKEKEDALEYLTAVSYILANNSPQKLTDPKDLSDISNSITDNITKFSTNFSDISYFTNLADKGSASLEQLKEVAVPEQLKDLHIRGLQLLTYAASLKDTAKPKKDDPIYNILNMSKVQSLLSLGTQFTTDVDTQLKDLGISDIPLNL